MSLGDLQIERYSRQIVLSQVGGLGQRRLLDAHALLTGTADLLETPALYLTGAGVGRITLSAASAEEHRSLTRLAAEMTALNADSSAELAVDPSAALASCALAIAFGASPDSLATWACGARASGVPLLAAAPTARGGWLYRSRSGLPCALCAKRTAGDTNGVPRDPLAASGAGMLGSLLALEAIAILLHLDAPAGARLWLLDTHALTFTERPIAAQPDCSLCAEPHPD